MQRLGQKPATLKEVTYSGERSQRAPTGKEKGAVSQRKELVGVDIYVDANSSVEELHRKMASYDNGQLVLTMITNRGAKVWPDTIAETTLCDQWRCRYQRPDGQAITLEAVVGILQKLSKDNVDFIQTENLYTFDGQPGFSHASQTTKAEKATK